jgi:hypothetical protein
MWLSLSWQEQVLCSSEQLAAFAAIHRQLVGTILGSK